MLSDEITADLRAIREKALRDTREADAASGAASPDGEPGPVTARLSSKGIDFGRITAFPDGRVDTSAVRGVDTDLRVRPFLHQGITASIREFIVGALNAEMGLQAWDPIICAATDPVKPQAMTSPSGFKFDPALDKFERPPSCSNAEDPDGDGHAGEIDPALVDYLEFYLLNYFKPGQYRTTPRAAEGLQFMEQIGCTTCHVRNLEVSHDRRVADAETTYDAERGIFNELFTEVYPLFGPLKDGDPYPQLLPIGGKFLVENVFTDLKRHDLGPNFHERDFDGSRITSHVTEPLWGVATTAPYGHDGRSVNLDAVIRRHGGEAEDVTRAYVALSAENQSKIIDFLADAGSVPSRRHRVEPESRRARQRRSAESGEPRQHQPRAAVPARLRARVGSRASWCRALITERVGLLTPRALRRRNSTSARRSASPDPP